MRHRVSRFLACVGLALAALGCTESGPRATADRISSRSQLIGGPKALGEIGDYLLENDQIRLIIHGPGPNRGNAVYGGTIIDADLQRPGAGEGRGNDHLGEIIPVFLFEGVEPVHMAVTADGSDGGPAIVTVEGVGGDLLQMVALLNTALVFPPDLEFRIDYVLYPGARYVEVRSTITNASASPHPFPFLDPTDLADLGLDVPGLDQLELSVPLGHLGLFGPDSRLFAPGPAGFNTRFAIEDSYADAGGFPAFPGLVTDYVATHGPGVSYGLAVPDASTNYASRYASLYPGQSVNSHSMLMSFTYAGVTGIFHTEAPEQLAPGESFTYSLDFIIGRGDVGSITDVVNDIRGVATESFTGRVLDAQTKQPIVGASVVVEDDASNLVTEYEVDATGWFGGSLPAGHYSYRVVAHGRDTAPAQAFEIAPGTPASVLVEMTSPARLALDVRDELGRSIPVKVTLVGTYDDSHRGQDPRTFLYDLRLDEPFRSTTFDDTRNEYIEDTFFAPHGTLMAESRPGTYTLNVSRGVEYDLHTEPIELEAGQTVTRTVVLKRAFDAKGWISADLHMHSAKSLDSKISLEDRVTTIAAEGVEFVASTEHNFLTDYQPVIAELQLEEWLTSTVGLELTTWEMGHFNGYPLKIDPGRVRGGDFTWAGEKPDRLFEQMRAMGKYGPADTIVQINHPRDNILGYFSQFNMDTETATPVPPQGLRGVFAPFQPEFDAPNFSLDADALEVFNGKRMDMIHHYRAPDPLPEGMPSPAPTPGEVIRDAAGRVAFPGVMEDWFTFLNGGMRITGVGNSDSHKPTLQEAGYPRNFVWVGPEKDQPAGFSDRDVVAAIQRHEVVFTNGPWIELTVNGAPVGSDVSANAGLATVHIHVVSANWAPFDHVVLWANGQKLRDLSVPAGSEHDFLYEETVTLTEDTWLLVEVTGTKSLFPVLPPVEFENLDAQKIIDAVGAGIDLTGLSPYGGLKPPRRYRVHAEGVTNPVWVDVDGNGHFDSLHAGIPTHPAAARPESTGRPDVRALFDAIPAQRWDR